MTVTRSKFKKWRPGQLVTINGIIYCVKRESELLTSCKQCAFSDGGPCSCSFPSELYEGYPIPEDCYLKRVSP